MVGEGGVCVIEHAPVEGTPQVPVGGVEDPHADTVSQPTDIKDCTRILGPHHPHTLTTRHHLAEAYRAAGRFDDADSLFKTPSDSEEDEQKDSEDNPDQETDS